MLAVVFRRIYNSKQIIVKAKRAKKGSTVVQSTPFGVAVTECFTVQMLTELLPVPNAEVVRLAA